MQTKKIIWNIRFKENDITISRAQVVDMDETLIWQLFASQGHIKNAHTRIEIDGCFEEGSNKVYSIRNIFKQLKIKQMKKIILFSLLILFFVVGLKAQEKGATKIIVAGVSYNAAIEALISSGFVIDKTDKDLQLITTQAMQTKSSPSIIKLQILIGKDSAAMITGMFKTTVRMIGGDEFMPVVNKGMKRSIYQQAFEMMDEFAKKLGSEISYMKQ